MPPSRRVSVGRQSRQPSPSDQDDLLAGMVSQADVLSIFSRPPLAADLLRVGRPAPVVPGQHRCSQDVDAYRISDPSAQRAHLRRSPHGPYRRLGGFATTAAWPVARGQRLPVAAPKVPLLVACERGLGVRSWVCHPGLTPTVCRHLAWCSRTWPQGKVGRFVRSRSYAVESAVLMIGVGNQGFSAGHRGFASW